MRHRLKGRKFGRYSSHRKALFMNLAKSLVRHERIVTSLAKAKDLRGVVERLITLAKDGTLHARRRVISFFGYNIPEVQKLFDHLAKRYGSRNGGYTRVLKYGFKKGDASPRAVIELMDNIHYKTEGKKKKEAVSNVKA